jgi:hypothetical protein
MQFAASTQGGSGIDTHAAANTTHAYAVQTGSCNSSGTFYLTTVVERAECALFPLAIALLCMCIASIVNNVSILNVLPAWTSLTRVCGAQNRHGSPC